jgi:hypothetical protein
LREIVYHKSYYKPELGLYFRDVIGFWLLGIARYIAGSIKSPRVL